MPSSKRPVTVLWNSAAGWSDSDEESSRVDQILSAEGALVTMRRMSKGEDIVEVARELIRQGSEVLVAAGGDGTVNAVASALVHTPAALGVIPAGTLNHFARDLSVPLDLDGAALTVREGHEVVVDVGSVNGRVFINNSVLGLFPVYRSAREAYERHGLSKTRVGRFIAVCRALLRVLWQFPHLKLELALEDGTNKKVQTAFVLVGNNEHELENWNIGHRETLNEGRLWVYVMRRCSRWAMVKYFARFLLKRFSRHSAFDIYRARQIHVEARSKTIRVGVDGEIVRMETPLVYRSLPNSLRVIAPAGYGTEELR